MNIARYEEAKKFAILDAMVQIQDEAKLKGHEIPIATKAMYDIALGAYVWGPHVAKDHQIAQVWPLRVRQRAAPGGRGASGYLRSATA